MTVADIRAVFISALRFFFIAVGSGDRLNSDTQAHGFRSEFRVGSHELCARAGGGDSR